MTVEQVRADVQAYLKANWDPNLGLVEWRLEADGLRLGHAPLAGKMVRARPAAWHDVHS